MSSSCRLALLLALGLAAATAASAQSSSSNSSTADPAQAQPTQNAAQSAGALSVQARIKARRAARRAAAIHEVYAHHYEAYTGMGLQRFEPGPGPCSSSYPCNGSFPHGMLEHAWEYAWNVGFTRYQNQRLGWNLDGRGYYSTAYVGGPYSPVNNGITNVAISQYAVMVGPSYRLYLHPKFSVGIRGLAGFEKGNFSGDTNHSTALATQLGLWDNGYTFAAAPAIPFEYNLTPKIGLRVAPEYYFTGFGSQFQHSRAFTLSIVYRFGKQ
jgi:putative component of toxin-antitoxin plasmid stabilization module